MTKERCTLAHTHTSTTQHKRRFPVYYNIPPPGVDRRVVSLCSLFISDALSLAEGGMGERGRKRETSDYSWNYFPTLSVVDGL